jgi:hypothetical protein
MHGIAVLAGTVAKNRRPLPRDHPLIERERAALGDIGVAMEDAREARDAGYERAFALLYGDLTAGRP